LTAPTLGDTILRGNHGAGDTMVQSKAVTVDDYIAELAADRAPHVKKLRALARRVLKGYEETMQWGMPAYVRQGNAEITFASQKQYLALYVMKPEVIAKNAKALAALDVGKSCVRMKKLDEIDWNLMEQLMVDTLRQ
jgi:uncharacterized protein YdhG (YjbR/CyaY superfamily)